jgi:photosystem II stability/assembly factor-like uncharacterized protein
MSTRVFIRSSVFLLVLLTSVMPLVVRAQWRLVTKLPSIGSTVYFLDKIGVRNVGFVGCQGHIVRTSDGGKTWTTVYSAGGNIDLRDFVFKDPLNGLAVGSRLFSYLSTTDGGLTWQSTGTTTTATSVTYLRNTNVLTMNTVSGAPAFSSANWGQTWSQTVVPPGQNGLAFGDSLVGIFSAHASGASLYRTTDGALTWTGTNFYEHIYSPIALDPLAGVYVGAAELKSEIWISRDSGETWTLRSKIAPIVPTGCLRYYHGHLWCQSGSNGVFVSDDTGLTWTSLCGPSRNIDSRFYNLDSTLIAADNQLNLWMMDDATHGPGASFISFRQVPVIMASPQCGLVDKRIDLIMNVCFDMLDSAYLTGSPRFQVIYPNVPAPLTTGSGVVVRYTPDSSHMYDTAYLHLAWGPPGHTLRDTIIKIIASVGGAATSVNVSDLTARLATTCRTLDTLIEIRGISCDMQELIGASLDDSSVFKLQMPALPDTINVRGSVFLHITANANDTGTFTTTLRIKIRTQRGVIDTVCHLSLDVLGIEHPTAANLKVSMLNLCDWQDTVLWIRNPNCRVISLEKLASSDSGLIVFDSVLPIQIPAQDSIPVHIRVQPSGKTLHYIAITVRTGSSLFDTTFVVVSKIINNSVPNPRLSALKFGLTSGCTPKRLPLILYNDKCADVKLVAVKWVIADAQFWFDPVSLPLVLVPGSFDSIIFHFAPSQLKQTTATITLTFELAGERRDTTIYVTGIGTDTESAVLNNEILNYPTITKCESWVDSVMFENVSCDTMVIASLYVWQTNGYTVLSPKLPFVVLPGDSVPVVVHLARRTDGAANDSIDIQYASTKPPHTPLRLRVNLLGSIQTKIAPPALSGLDFENIHLTPCAEFDSFFVIANTNECDTIVITNLHGLNGVVSMRSLPYPLPPGARDTIRFHFTPPADTASGSVVIQGTKLDTTIPISTLRAHSAAITCTPSSFAPFVAPMCHVASDSLILSAYGCDSVVIDRIEITPSPSNYFLLDHYSLPYTLNGTMKLHVRYDPSPGEPDSASLYLHSVDGKLDLRIPLKGLTTALQTARLAIRNELPSTISSVAAGQVTKLTLFTRDAIDDSLALSDISCSLNLNQNVMTLIDVAPGPHFTTVSSSQQPSRMSLALHRSDRASLSSNATLATLTFTTFVSDTLSTTASLTSATFNAYDNTYEECVLVPVVDTDAVTVAIAPECNRDLLSDMIAGRGILTAIKVHPSVLKQQDQLQLDITSRAATSINIRILNILGQEAAHITFPIPAGSSTQTLETSRLRSGLFFVEISDGTAITIQRIVLAQ